MLQRAPQIVIILRCKAVINPSRKYRIIIQIKHTFFFNTGIEWNDASNCKGTLSTAGNEAVEANGVGLEALPDKGFEAPSDV